MEPEQELEQEPEHRLEWEPESNQNKTNSNTKTKTNYLGTLELLSQLDPFLHEHIQKHSGKGNTSYLSANICEEFICLMGNKVLIEIISELKKSKTIQLNQC